VRVDFYTVGERFIERPLTLVCKLCHKAHAARLRTQVLCVDLAQAQALDAALWSFDADVFLPHALAGEPNADRAPIVLCVGRAALNGTLPYIVNLTTTPEPLTGPLTRLAEVILLDETAKLNGRARFRAYRAAGLDPQHHVL
jgi:DNA polymerase III subunit chi